MTPSNDTPVSTGHDPTGFGPMRPDPNRAEPSRPDPIRDARTTPRGVLPRQLQTWLMVGLALAILGIILVTGRTTPVRRTGPAAGPRTATALTPDRIQAYERQLADDQARLQRALAAGAAPDAQPPHTLGGGRGSASPSREPSPADPMTDDQRRRDYQSLFADNVAFTRRSGDLKPPASADAMARSASAGNFPPMSSPALPTLTPSPALPTPAVTPPQPPPSPMAAPPLTPLQSSPISMSMLMPMTPVTGPTIATAPASASASSDTKDRLTEGTVIETVLINRLDGTFVGPVTCLVTTPVYSQDRQRIVIPAGARVLGRAAPVQSWGDSRLAVSFHRLVMPDGRTTTLDQFKGLDQIGDTGLKDQVNRHYLQVFGASVAIGALSGLAQAGTTTGFAPSDFENAYRQAAGASLAASAGRVLDRYLNVLPTITIREGYRITIYLTGDLDLPRAVPDPGGVQ